MCTVTVVPYDDGFRLVCNRDERRDGLNAGEYDRFRLVLVQIMTAVVLTSDGRTLSIETMTVSRPFMVTSSSLGDAGVEVPRRRLFERSVLKHERALWLDSQARFHAHQGRSRADISVTMERADARTVSRTFISVTSKTMELRYEPLACAGRAVGRAA